MQLIQIFLTFGQNNIKGNTILKLLLRKVCCSLQLLLFNCSSGVFTHFIGSCRKKYIFTSSLIKARQAGEGMLRVGETGTNSAAFGFN